MRMRLLRMTTVDPNCIFNETLHRDITLPPNSSIALKNLTLEANTSLTINGSNDTITYELTAGNPNIAYLTHRIYLKVGFRQKNTMLKSLQEDWQQQQPEVGSRGWCSNIFSLAL